MKRRKYSVEQTEAPIKIIETTVKEVVKKDEDVDTITLQFIFQNGIRFSKKFYKYTFDYIKEWANKEPGDPVSLKVKSNIVIDII